MATKKFMYLNRKAPYGTVYALESLEVVLIGAAFEQDADLRQDLGFVYDNVFEIAEEFQPIGMMRKHPCVEHVGIG